jgi:hypothetical protein
MRTARHRDNHSCNLYEVLELQLEHANHTVPLYRHASMPKEARIEPRNSKPPRTGGVASPQVLARRELEALALALVHAVAQTTAS